MGDKTTDEVADVPAPSGGSKIVPILVIVNTLLVGGVLFFVMKKAPAPATAATAPQGEKGAPTTEAEKKAAGPGHMIKLDNFVIQLRAVDAERYVRVAFDLEVGAQATDEQPVKDRLPILRDAVIAYFSDRALEELRGSEGMERTKAALLKKMDEIIPGRRVRNIYITDFIIQ